jgi:hypothetical protein
MSIFEVYIGQYSDMYHPPIHTLQVKIGEHQMECPLAILAIAFCIPFFVMGVGALL